VTSKNLKIAVVGGGIYGVTSAVYLARKGHRVDLFERHHDILQEASGMNQFRLHRGYHYPRSSETVLSLLRVEPKFREEFEEAVVGDVEHYYCIAKVNSLTSAEQYIDFCRAHSLEFSLVDFPMVNKDQIEICMKTEESLYDPYKLRQICWEHLKKAGVNIFLKKQVFLHDLDRYDIVVIAVYSRQGEVLKEVMYPVFYQYEVCEKPVVWLPSSFRKKSIVIMDGPFMSVDPLGNTELFVLGHVVHAIHQSYVGTSPMIDPKLAPLLNRGIIKNPSVTHFSSFIHSDSKFIPELKHAKHVGSMFVVRTILPFQDATDARPTLVNYVNDRIINIFSGKIVNCIEAAEEVVTMIERTNLYNNSNIRQKK
jgi:hypothetical protein